MYQWVAGVFLRLQEALQAFQVGPRVLQGVSETFLRGFRSITRVASGATGSFRGSQELSRVVTLAFHGVSGKFESVPMGFRGKHSRGFQGVSGACHEVPGVLQSVSGVSGAFQEFSGDFSGIPWNFMGIPRGFRGAHGIPLETLKRIETSLKAI